MFDIPDAIPANIADLFEQRVREGAPLPGLPRPDFSDNHHAELALLMVALVGNASGSKPAPMHYAALATGLVVAMHESHKRMLDRAIEEKADPEIIANLGQILAVISMCRFTIEQTMEFLRRVVPPAPRGERVSDQFLSSLGLERAQFDAWLNDSMS